MANFDESLFNLAGRITQPIDFAFQESSGRVANKIREEFSTAVPSARLQEIGIDDDGDVRIETDRGLFFASAVGVVAGGVQTKPEELDANSRFMAHVLDWLFSAKGNFAANSFNVRLGFRFTPKGALDVLRQFGFDQIFGNVVRGDDGSGEIEKLRYLSNFKLGMFNDSLELEASHREIQLRYIRDYPYSSPGSFAEFLQIAELHLIFRRLRPFAEQLSSLEERRSIFGRARSRPLSDLQ